jgi:hypothetical protein
VDPEAIDTADEAENAPLRERKYDLGAGDTAAIAGFDVAWRSGEWWRQKKIGA